MQKARDTSSWWLVISVLVVLGSAACSTQPVSNSESKPIPAEQLLDAAQTKEFAGSARLVVKRDPSLARVGGCVQTIFLNAKPVAELRQGEIVTFYVQPGDHIVSSKTEYICGNATVEMLARAKVGETFTVRISMDGDGRHHLSPTAF